MWVAGIIALCQITFLPGAVLFRYLRLRGLNPIERITGMFAASLILNCLLVSLFTALHIHKAPVWWVLIAIEAIYLAGTYTSRAEAWTLDLRHIEALRKLSFQAAISGILLFAGILVMGYVLYKDWGTVYTANDDVGSWDRWATEWSSGHFPEYTSIYPQLLPSNSSITYVLLGTADVKMFAKAIAPIYDLLPVLLFLSLALRRRDASYLIGGALCAWLWVHYLGMAFMLYGYADVPLAFFGFLTLYCVYRSTGTPDRYAVIAGLIASCGALLTKQGGIYVVGVMAAYSFYWKLRLARQPEKEPPPSAQKQPLPSKEAAAAKRPKHAKQISHAKQPSLAKQPAAPLATVAPPASVARDLPFFRRDTATVLLLVVAGFCAVWYAVKYYQVSRGTEFLQMALLTQGLHHGRSYGERIVATGRMFLTCRAYTAPVFTSAIAVLSIGSLFLQRTRVIALFCLFPFLLLYSMFFSYEIRNAALAFPFIALVCGETLHKWLRAIPRFFAGKSSINRTFIVALASACIAAWFLTGERGRDLFPEVSACLTNPWISEAVDVYAPAVFVIAVLCLILITFVRIESGVFEAGKLAAAACVVWVLWGAVTHPADLLVTSQRQAAWETIGDPGVNMKLREMLGGKHINMPIVTDYWFLRSLPDMRDLFRRTTCGGPCTVNVLHADMRTYSDAGFILLGEGNLAPETREAFDRGSEFTTLFLVNGYRFVQINRNAGPLAQQH